MIDIKTAISEFFGLIGIYQSNDPQYPKIDAALTTSTSGRYLQQAHPLCTIENIFNSAPEFNKFIYTAWSASDYAIGDRVKVGTKIYQAKTAVLSTDGSPETLPSKWDLIDPFSYWLRKQYEQAIIDLVTAIIRGKKMDNTHKSLLDSLVLYDGLARITDRVIKHNRFVGYEIDISRQEGLFVIFDQIGIQADSMQDALTFYLYHSSVRDPLATYTIPIGKVSTFNWAVPVNDALASDIGVKMNFFSKDHNTEGYFYFGYYESDLVGQVFNKVMNISEAPCSGCNPSNEYAFNKWSKYVSLTSIAVPEAYLDADRKMFNELQVNRYFNTNWGLNIAVSSWCDITQFMVRNKYLLADVLNMQLALNMLTLMAFTTRYGVLPDKVKALALSELDEDLRSGSFKAQYTNAVTSLTMDLSGLNSACLPCVTSKGIYMGTIR